MRGRRREFIGLVVVSLLTLSAPAVADEHDAAVIWYRASDTCPAGAEFVAKLSERVPRARLARAGDHIDFIVTLVVTAGETVGRLERQTKGGTVAMRELRDASCQSVADAMVMTVALALDPQQLGAPVLSPAMTPEPPVPSPAKAREPPLVVAPVVAKPEAFHPAWHIGLQAGALAGVAPSVLARADVFVDDDHLLSKGDLALRLALVGAYGSIDTEAVGSVHQWVVAGRSELCPLRLGGSRAGLRPCVAGELGATGASDDRPTGLRDSGVWAAPGVALRGDLALPPFRVEAEIGAMLPLVRQDIIAGQVALYRTESAVFYAALGVSIVPW